MACFTIPGDLALNSDETDLVFTQGAAAISQQIKVGAQVFRGRWKYDRNVGLRALEAIFVKGPSLPVIRAEFWAFFASIPGVVEVLAVDLRLERSTRTLFVKYSLKCDSGETLAETLGLSFV